jgi:hypothetical protein
MVENKIEAEVSSLLDGRRSFSIKYANGEEKEFFIGPPTADDVRKADWEHAKIYNRALKEGVFTTSEMLEILKSRNIIGEQYEKTGHGMKVLLAEKIVAMERELDRDKRIDVALEVARLREEVYQWNHRLTGPMANTCESISSDARTEYLTSAVIQHKDGKRLWATYEDYRQEKDLALQTKARFEVMLWLEGVDSDFMDRAPENRVLRELLNEDNFTTDGDIPAAAEEVIETPVKVVEVTKAAEVKETPVEAKVTKLRGKSKKQ